MKGLDESDKGSFQDSGRQWRLLLFPKMKNQKRPVIAEQISLIVLKNHAPFLRILAIFLFQGVKNRSVKISAAQKPGPVFHIPCYDSPFGSNSQVDGKHRPALSDILHDGKALRPSLPLLHPIRHMEGITSRPEKGRCIIISHERIRTAVVPDIREAKPKAGAAHPHNLIIGKGLSHIRKCGKERARPWTFHSFPKGQPLNSLEHAP